MSPIGVSLRTVRTVITSVFVLVLALFPTVAVATGDGGSFDDLLSPSDRVLTAREQVEATAQKAVAAAREALEFENVAAEAERQRDAALREMQTAQSQVEQAREELGEYAAGAYISGGSAANAAATLSQADPSELVSRQNALSAVAGTSAEWVAVLKSAEFQAGFYHERAQVFAAEAQVAVGGAKGAALLSEVLAGEAQALFDELVAQELAEQARELEEALRRAQAAALSATGGSGNYVPAELLEFGNGHIPRKALTPVGDTGHYLWRDAAVAFEALLAAAEADGVVVGITDSYRSFDGQVQVARKKGIYSDGGLAAVPGTSNHGWGTAVDLRLDKRALAWMREHAFKFGYVEDVPREPWHWHYIGDPLAVDLGVGS